MTDVHVHMAALPSDGNGCLVSKRLLRSPLLRFVAWSMGLPLGRPAEANRRYLERLEAELERSESVDRAVLLAMDGAYDSSGRLDEGGTDLLVPNDVVFEAVRGRPRLLAGASINPNRRDALDEARRCAERGAALVKVLPNAQVFDPADRRHRPFFRLLGELNLPVLTHVGFEFSLAGRDQTFGDLSRWRAALDEGASVIAAHGCSNGVFFSETHLATMLELARAYPRFYVDTSALTLPNRVGALLRLRALPEIHDRLLFGTDYPLPCFGYPCLLAGRVSGWSRAYRAASRFDRHRRVLEALGVPAGRDFIEVFGRK